MKTKKKQSQDTIPTVVFGLTPDLLPRDRVINLECREPQAGTASEEQKTAGVMAERAPLPADSVCSKDADMCLCSSVPCL